MKLNEDKFFKWALFALLLLIAFKGISINICVEGKLNEEIQLSPRYGTTFHVDSNNHNLNY